MILLCYGSQVKKTLFISICSWPEPIEENLAASLTLILSLLEGISSGFRNLITFSYSNLYKKEELRFESRYNLRSKCWKVLECKFVPFVASECNTV